MSDQQLLNYSRIANAIEYIKNNYALQPSLENIAEQVHLSPFHFQRLFTEWAGTTPKKFLQYISVQHAKDLLKKDKATITETAHATGLSGTSRLHDMFVKLEGMTPAEYKNCGINLRINYSYTSTPFGNIIVASTAKGVCYMAFYSDQNQAYQLLKDNFFNATFIHKIDSFQNNVLQFFNDDWSQLSTIKLHLKGTDFQLKVWEALLNIPFGSLSTYGAIAESIGNPNASRAVGTAIGSNPVAYLIPCHRVIQSSGNIGGYMWGNTRKTAIIGWESVKSA